MPDDRTNMAPALAAQVVSFGSKEAAPETAIVAAGSSGVSADVKPATRESRRDRRAAKRKERSAKPRRFTRAELREHLRISSAGLIEEIHSLALRQNQAEDQRETRLDGKATSLLATAGLAATVAFAFGNMLTPQSTFFSRLGEAARIIPILYVTALLFGSLSTIWALRALRIRNDYKTLSDEDVFNEVELERIQRAADGDDKKAQAEFRRYITIQHWSFYRLHGDIHDRKADLIRNGQRFFVAFVCTLLLIGAGIACSAFTGVSNQSNKPATGTVTP